VDNRYKKTLKIVLKLGITLAALYYVFTQIDIAQTWLQIKKANVMLLFGATLLFILSKGVSSFRLNRFFGNISIHITEKQNLKLYWLGMFYNLSLPGGIGGDGYKVILLNRSFKVKAADIFWAVMLDRVIGVLALFCLAVVFFMFVPFPFPYKGLVVFAIPASIGASYLVFKWFFKKHVGIFAITNLQSLLVQLLQVLCAWLILMALGEKGQVTSYLLVFLVSSIVAILPLTIGGAGAREVAFLFGAQWLGLDVNVSIALSLLFYAITVVISLWGTYYVVKPVKFHNTMDQQTMGPDAIS
jgi:glycosyltransferase 2 family protein